MTAHANVKPLTYWLIHKGYTVRFTRRTPGEVAGILTTPEGSSNFTYTPAARTVNLPDHVVHLNEYGWEVTPDADQPPPAADK